MNVSCNSKEELHHIEGQIIRRVDCVNKNIAGRTCKQYRTDNSDKYKQYKEDHKVEIKQYNKQHYAANSEKLKIQMKQYQLVNSEKIKHYNKQRYAANSEKFKHCSKQRYVDKLRVCVCGSTYCDTPYKTQQHCNTDKHINWVSDFYIRIKSSLNLNC